MAYVVEKINPLDLQSRKAIGFSLPLSGRAVFNSTYQTKDVIKTNLINYFLTRKGERYLNPSFGNTLPSLLFEQYDEKTVDEIEFQIREEVSIYFPRVNVNEILIERNPDKNIVTLNMRYNIQNSSILDEITINFE